MKVLMIDAGNYTPYYDYQLCQGLMAEGIRVEMMTSPFIYEDLPFAADPMVRYHFFRALTAIGRGTRVVPGVVRRGLKAIEYPCDLAALLRHAAAVRPDVVHFQWLLAPRMEILVADQLRRLGCRIVYTVHNVQPHAGKGMGGALYRRIAAAMDALVVHSESAKVQLAALLDGHGAKVCTIPHGSLFGDGERRSRREARRYLGLPDEGRIVLFFGLLESYKGLNYLIKSLPAVVGTHPDTRLLVAGKPGQGFDSSLALLNSTGMAAFSILRLGFVPSKNVGAYFCAADVVALPYVSGSQSGVLLTAYTFGRPVVTTRPGGLGETVAGDGTGYVVEAGDVAGLGDALVRMLGNPEAAEEMGERARQLATGRYSWRRIARSTAELYRGDMREAV